MRMFSYASLIKQLKKIIRTKHPYLILGKLFKPHQIFDQGVRIPPWSGSLHNCPQDANTLDFVSSILDSVSFISAVNTTFDYQKQSTMNIQ